MPAVADKAERRWFITGASGGLGRELTRHALESGDRVTATLRRPGALDELSAEYGERLTVEQLDVTDFAHLGEVIDRTVRTAPVDILVNNAGYAVVGATEEMTVAQIRDQIEVLLLAPMLLTRAFLQPMREQGGGRIIQISSVGGQLGIPTHSAYHAGKWGLEGFSESVSREVAGFGIGVTIVEPGATRTGFGSALRFAEELPAYRDTAVEATRRQLAAMQDSDFPGDPAKVAAAIYRTTRAQQPPLRLALGSDTYQAVHAALTERLTALEAQQDQAAAIEFD